MPSPPSSLRTSDTMSKSLEDRCPVLQQKKVEGGCPAGDMSGLARATKVRVKVRGWLRATVTLTLSPNNPNP
jgi:hypothetical protein